MHASLLLHGWLSNVLSPIHIKRRNALASVIAAAMSGGRLTVTALGRAIAGEAKEKHKIKRADRLLSNTKLAQARTVIYGDMARHIIGMKQRLIVLVDWSDLDNAQEYFLLRASTPVGGRALTLYEEVHTLRTKEKPKTHRNFLRQLRQLLPPHCRPILVTDAGFRTPWFKQVQDLGWDWVGRVRNREQYTLQQSEDLTWLSCKSLYSAATRTPKFVGQVLLTARNAFSCRMVLYKAKAKGRKNLTRRGKSPALSIKSKRNAASQREPWLLATSLPVDKSSAKRVVKIYATRMQIEEAFRDLKNTRLGLSLELARTTQLSRLANLVLIGSLTATFAWLCGKATQLAGLHRHFQANSIKHSTVLSTFFVGIRAFKDPTLRLAPHLFDLAKVQLAFAVAAYDDAY
jgi:hypothetical protein